MKKLLHLFVAGLFILSSCGGDSHSSEDVNQINDVSDFDDNQEEIQNEFSTQNPLYLYVAAFTGLNLRSEPSTSGSVLGRIEYGNYVELIESTGISFESNGFQGEWIEVTYEDQKGFLFDGFLLPVEAPGFNPNATLPEYFNEQLYPIDHEIYQKNINNTGNEQADWVTINEEDFEIQEESDYKRSRREFAGGFIFYEEIGWEYHAYKGFFPDMTLQQGFLMARAMYPKFYSGEDCFLDLSTLPYPRENQSVNKDDIMCEYDIEVGKDEKARAFIYIGNSMTGYTGIRISEVEGGVEIKNFFAL